MPIPCSLQIDGGTPQVVTPVATVILQGSTTATIPMRIRRIELQSNAVSSTTAQIITIQYGYYVTAPATGGLTPIPFPINEALQGLYTPQTSFRSFTTSLGTAFIPRYSWLWRNDLPFNPALTPGTGQAAGPMPEVDEQVQPSTVWAYIIPGLYIPPGQQPFSVTGTLQFEEFH